MVRWPPQTSYVTPYQADGHLNAQRPGDREHRWRLRRDPGWSVRRPDQRRTSQSKPNARHRGSPPLTRMKGSTTSQRWRRVARAICLRGWISYRDGADSLVIGRYTHEGDRFQPQGQWTAIRGEGTYLLGLHAVPTESGAFFLFSQEVNGNWDVFAVMADASGPSAPIRITSGPETEIKPTAAWHDGTLFVAWEANPNSQRQVYTASLRDGTVTPPEAVSLTGDSNYGPSLVVVANGRISVAWHSYRDHNYDVYLRHRAASGEWSGTRRLTRSPGIDRHARLFVRGSELWILYEHARMEGYFVGRTDERHLVVARVTPHALEAPPNYWGTSPLATSPFRGWHRHLRFRGALVDRLPATARTTRRLGGAPGRLHRRSMDRSSRAIPAALNGPPRSNGPEGRSTPSCTSS